MTGRLSHSYQRWLAIKVVKKMPTSKNEGMRKVM